MVKAAKRHSIGDVREFVKHSFWDAVTIREDWLSCGKRSDIVMWISWSVTNVWTLSPMKITFIPVEECWYRTYMIDTLGPVDDRYVGYVLDDGHIDLLEKRVERYKAYGEGEWSWLVVRENERKLCVEIYWFSMCSKTNVNGQKAMYIFVI